MRRFLEQQRYWIDYTVAALWRRKTHNLGILLVYTLLVFLFSSVLLFSQSLRQEVALLLQKTPEVLVQKLVAGRHDMLPADWLEALRRIRGVHRVEGRLWGYYYDPAVKANYTVMVAPERGLAEGELWLGADLARVRQVAVGDYFSIRTATGHPLPLKVVGVLHSGSALLSADLMLLSETTYRRLFNWPAGVYTDAAVHVRNPREAATVATKIVQMFPESRPILRAEILRTYEAVLSWREGVLFLILSVLLVAFLILAWDKAAGLSAEEQREIGLLKALGWETADILRMKLWEGLLLSFTAFLAGYILAYGHVFYGGGGLFVPVLKGWAVLYPQFTLTPAVDGGHLLVLLTVTVVPYLAATLVPGWRVALREPDASMRDT